MQLKPFLLDAWLDQYEHNIEFNLAASTGPTWTVNDILALADEETRHRFLHHNLVYSRPAGADSLREAIAEMQGVPVEAVQIVTGASEALVALMWQSYSTRQEDRRERSRHELRSARHTRFRCAFCCYCCEVPALG